MDFVYICVAGILGLLTYYMLTHKSTSVSVVHKSTNSNTKLVQKIPSLKNYSCPTWLGWFPLAHTLAVDFKHDTPIQYRNEKLSSCVDGVEQHIFWKEVGIKNPQAPIVLVVPGITGQNQSPYIKHLVRSLHGDGYRVVVWNRPNPTEEDFLHKPDQINRQCVLNLDIVIQHVQKLYPQAPLYAVSYSLGACILVHYLGEHKQSTPLRAAMCISGVFGDFGDVQSGWSPLKKLIWLVVLAVFNRTLYQHVVRLSKTPEFLQSWNSNSAVRKVSIPLLAVHAHDDPVVVSNILPWDHLQDNENIIVATTEYGGHSGWLHGGYPLNKPSWIEYVALEWLHANKENKIL
eukprot:TRINITY_DN2943_c0_g1_i1.p1 TRINITY_DN2943_c0_g1~~TRINITY_DN2943_c0_g1_i1.p1  ORF type:complete len:346 (-),score=43.13 TRINITY_DN2943_c0_g1_i1:26-1063(-)